VKSHFVFVADYRAADGAAGDERSDELRREQEEK
jgi:hypothetical protein